MIYQREHHFNNCEIYTACMYLQIKTFSSGINKGLLRFDSSYYWRFKTQNTNPRLWVVHNLIEANKWEIYMCKIQRVNGSAEN